MYNCKVEIAKSKYICKTPEDSVSVVSVVSVHFGVYAAEKEAYLYIIYILYINKNFFSIFIASFLTETTETRNAKCLSFPRKS